MLTHDIRTQYVCINIIWLKISAQSIYFIKLWFIWNRFVFINTVVMKIKTKHSILSHDDLSNIIIFVVISISFKVLVIKRSCQSFIRTEKKTKLWKSSHLWEIAWSKKGENNDKQQNHCKVYRLKLTIKLNLLKYFAPTLQTIYNPGTHPRKLSRNTN